MVKKIWGKNWKEKMNIEKEMKWNKKEKKEKKTFILLFIYFSIEYVESLWWGIDDSGLRRWENSW
jgi:hypothetical protein